MLVNLKVLVDLFNQHIVMFSFIQTYFVISEQTQLNIPTRPPSLGQVILAVKHLSTHLHDASSVVEDLRVKSNTISHLSNEELDVFVSSDLATTNKVMSTNERRLLVSSIINSSIAEKEHQIKLAQGSIEKATLLIWAHLEHFIFYANADSDSSLTPYQKAYRVQIGNEHTHDWYRPK